MSARITSPRTTSTQVTGTQVTGTQVTSSEVTGTQVTGGRILPGPGAPADLLALPWHELTDEPDPPLIAVCAGYDAAWESEALALAREQGRPLLSVRATPAEVLLGPLWTPDDTSACAGCAQVRDTDHDAPGQAHEPTTAPAAPPAPRRRAAGAPVLAPALGQLLAELLRDARPLLAPGDLLALTHEGRLRRHRVTPSHRCPVCASDPGPRVARSCDPPPPRPLLPRPTSAQPPDRGEPPFGLDPERMRAALTDPRFGPVLGTQRLRPVAMAMTETRLLGATFPGYGRGSTFRRAEPVGCLEAYERSAGYPHVAPLVRGATARELGEQAIGLAGLGHHTARQLDSPLSSLRPFDEDTPMDWVWGHPLDGGRPLLVPAEVGFYQYSYPALSDAPEHAGRTRHFHDSSSGCALGGSYEEAALHSLLELAERDAFLLSWHRRRPLPRIAAQEITDRECRLLIRQIEEQGYQVHLLVATIDLAIPVVWVMALREDGRMPATLSSAGSGVDPVAAARAGLWELSQMVSSGADWDIEAARPLATDPWLVAQMSDHHKRYAYPELLPRMRELLGGPVVSPAQAFPGWPDVFTNAADGDVTQALRFVAELFRQAGLERIVVVDQSTPEHTAAGLSVVKSVVPGILPMCFGQAQQRLAGIPRLASAVAEATGTPPREEDFPFDPHPFP
ncbi:TOMM precursor leader peptide-binding protein [Kitasatospora sp. NBC_01250]|uniref:TOMM precursor leader peptide-binding protein n=1 Tax=Kitasatospora sp. NBC_01250 TaxID=2903571 RepID=UPI002E307C3C|nr:TOMM precursor leader peptide-binding protein [Kitasatospora sp. NBC_01250]